MTPRQNAIEDLLRLKQTIAEQIRDMTRQSAAITLAIKALERTKEGDEA